LILGPTAWVGWLTHPSLNQILCLAVFGVVQMGIPYWLFARSLKVLSPQEAGIITLLEPLLNPVWAYLIDPEKESLPIGTLIGGGILLFALVWRYWPSSRTEVVPD
jgi:drug/metabolite transporter (DMT)-like permease